MLLENGINLLSKCLLKPCTFNPSLSVQEKNFNKYLSSATVTVECVFVILKVRWRGLLTMLVTNRENVSNAINTCFVLHKSIRKKTFYMKL